MKYQKHIVTVTEVTYARKGGVYTEMKSKFGPVLAYENGSKKSSLFSLAIMHAMISVTPLMFP